MKITETDIREVAEALNIEPTQKRIEFCKANFKEESEKDPTATFDLVIENMLYDDEKLKN